MWSVLETDVSWEHGARGVGSEHEAPAGTREDAAAAGRSPLARPPRVSVG